MVKSTETMMINNSYGAVASGGGDDSFVRVTIPATYDHEVGEKGVLLSSSNDNSCESSVAEETYRTGGEASIPSEIINMSKNLIGCGVLSLSGGIAMYSDSPSALISATFWIIVLGAIFGYFCLLIAKVCTLTKSVTYRECWERSMGDRGALAVSVVYAVKPAMANLAYSTILSQTIQSLGKTINVDIGNVEALVIVTIFAILPLCLLKNIHVLAPFSVLGTAGSIATAVAMSIRYFDGTYQEGGLYYEDIPPVFRPRFGDRLDIWSWRVLPYVCMLYEAYVMHYNSPRFYVELKDPTIPRFTTVVSSAFGFSAVINFIIAASGFMTFGSGCDSFILNNYSPNDHLATFCRSTVGASTLLTYPIVFIGVRDGVLDVFSVSHESRTGSTLNMVTVILLTVITLIAMVVTDLGVINAVGGGLVATIICLVFPALMYWKAVGDLGILATVGHHREVIVALSLMVFGSVLGLFGAIEALAKF